MHDPRTLLRDLVLLSLSVWIGIAARPAEAQQTVTLSGRVTDPWGKLRLGGVATATIDRTEFGLSYKGSRFIEWTKERKNPDTIRAPSASPNQGCVTDRGAERPEV